MVGTAIGRYRIEARLGAGGMGIVYRAFDTELRRPVALKILATGIDAGSRARLLHEARAASALNHPHICTIHEVDEADGQAFLVMEYVDGQDLGARIPPTGLPADTVLRYGLQIASAIAHAHERGIIHRDLKTANVVIGTDGRAKVLDFGIARHTSDLDVATESRALSQDGQIAGTLAYLAPEVLQGRPADQRSDLWAFGVLLYEMTTGQRPFVGGTSFELVSSVLRDSVPALPATVPPGLAAVINRCLAREPDRRYQRGGEVYAALETLSPAVAPIAAASPVPRRTRWPGLIGAAVVALIAAAVLANVAGLRSRFLDGRSTSDIRIGSIAVLPLENLSGDPEQEYFADGMTEALISNLARIGALKVISRTSAMRYKNTPKSLPEIARDLNVDAVVEGSVQRQGDRIRITAQLIHAATDTHLWARDYDGTLADTLRLQSDVSRAIANEIRIQVTPQEQARLARARAVDPAAYESFLRGRYHYWRMNEPDLKQAIAYFERAIQLAPNYAAAYAGLSQAWNERGVWGAASFAETERPQREAAERAVALDDSLADAHAAMAHVRYVREWDWAGAEWHFRRALELDPGSLEARNLYSVLLMALARHDEAIAQIERGVDLDPLSSVIRSTYGRVLYRARRYEQAELELKRALELDERNSGAYGRLADVYEVTKRYDEALALNDKAEVLRGGSMGGRYSPSRARLFLLAGRRDEAYAIVERAKTGIGAGSPLAVAEFYAAAGDHDQAFALLNRAIDQRLLVVFLKTEPKLDALRNDPRWPALLRRINLTP